MEPVERAALLARLPAPARRFWTDVEARRKLLRDIIVAERRFDADAGQLVASVDSLVTQGLEALGLPRGAIQGVRLVSLPGQEFGAKLPDSWLEIARDRLRDALQDAASHPDAVLLTWLHESLHARQPYASNWWADEYSAFPGYEEGLVGGLAILALQQLTGLPPVGGAIGFYVRCYQQLAIALGIDLEELWLLLWQAATGTVRVQFVPAIRNLAIATGRSLGNEEYQRIASAADSLFARGKVRARLSDAEILAWWKGNGP